MGNLHVFWDNLSPILERLILPCCKQVQLGGVLVQFVIFLLLLLQSRGTLP